MINFPTKKIFYFFIPVIIGLGLLFSIKNSVSVDGTSGNLSVISNSSERPKLSEEDINNNGKPDWQEDFNQTTDKPKDSENLTLTEKASIELFSDYLSIKQGGSIDANTIDTLASNFENKNAPVAYSVYSEKDIRINPLQDSSALKKYGNDINIIRSFYESKFSTFYDENPVSGINSSFWSLAKEASKLYEEMTKEMKNVSVPKSLISQHLLLLNNYAQASFALEDISIASTDPLKSIQGVNNYLSLQSEEYQTLLSIANYLKDNGIIYDTNEPGYFLNNF